MICFQSQSQKSFQFFCNYMAKWLQSPVLWIDFLSEGWERNSGLAKNWTRRSHVLVAWSILHSRNTPYILSITMLNKQKTLLKPTQFKYKNYAVQLRENRNNYGIAPHWRIKQQLQNVEAWVQKVIFPFYSLVHTKIKYQGLRTPCTQGFT